MLVRGNALEIPLQKGMSGRDVLTSLQDKVEKLNGPQGAMGRRALKTSLPDLSDFPENSVRLLAMTPEGGLHGGGGNSEIIFGMHTPWPAQHLLVMPSLDGHEGVETRRSGNDRLYACSEGETSFDVMTGFTPDKEYTKITFGLSGTPLFDYHWQQDDHPNASMTNTIVASWAIALGYGNPYDRS